MSPHHPTAARELTGVHWCCTHASPRGRKWVTCAWHNAGKIGFESFVRCCFETDSYEKARDHVIQEGHHWITAYPNGDRNKTPLGDIHSSDTGGTYTSVYALNVR